MSKILRSPLYLLLLLAIPSCLFPLTARAQVSADGTTSTTVNQNGNNFTIEQGDRAGDNLFHSFDEFSVPTGGSAAFNNAGDIANIFSRVTGNNISNIDGLLSANGAANLYLINPNGIIFGENARLDLGGSFFASTADSLLFEGSKEFSASNPQATPLLDVSIPIGLSFRDKPEDIVNRSFAPNSAGEFAGLEVTFGNTLAFVGGNINFETGRANASGGNIYLGGLAEAGIVNLNEDSSLSFPEDITLANVSLTNLSFVNVGGLIGGNITIDAKNLNLEGVSLILGGITSNSTDPNAQAGDVIINVAENISLNDSLIGNQVSGIGKPGKIIINTGFLEIINGGDISTTTFGQGNAGSIEIAVTGDIIADGEDLGGIPSGIVSLVAPGAVGDSEGIKISTTNLKLTNGGRINSSTGGQGNAGTVKITATGDINADGEGSNGNTPSGISSTVARGALGNGGKVKISTNNLNLTNGGSVDSSSFGLGNAGAIEVEAINTVKVDGLDSEISSRIIDILIEDILISQGITINAKSVLLTNAGQVTSQVLGLGKAGDININAKELIFIDGGDINEGVNLGDESNEFNFERGGINSSLILGGGSGGDINISTNKLNINNEGGIVSDDSVANANSSSQPGDINIVANSINLNRSALIRATTSSQIGFGANINLTLAEDIKLENNSSISARAFDNATGGSVTINANDGFILAFPNQNNDIIANASEGNGGNININTQAIFGLEERLSRPANQTNDIDASSEFGLQGDFSLNIPNFDPTTGLLELPEAVSDASDQISQNPCEQGVGSEFLITGKGGFPANPQETLNSDRVKVGLIEPVPSQQQTQKSDNTNPEPSKSEPVPAQGWVFNEEGKVIFTAYSTRDTPTQRSEQQHHTTCSRGLNP